MQFLGARGSFPGPATVNDFEKPEHRGLRIEPWRRLRPRGLPLPFKSVKFPTFSDSLIDFKRLHQALLREVGEVGETGSAALFLSSEREVRGHILPSETPSPELGYLWADPDGLGGGMPERVPAGLGRAGWIGLRNSLPVVGVAAVIGIRGTHPVDHSAEQGDSRVIQLTPGAFRPGAIG